MLYPLSYESLCSACAQDVQRVSVPWARAGYLAPTVCAGPVAARCRPASDQRPDARRRLYGWWRRGKSRRSRSDAVAPSPRCRWPW
jgi:hypothetical protein